MKTPNIVALAAAILLIPSVALAWKASNRHRVNPISSTVYEVVGRPGSGGPEFWCAAGDYARRVLGASATRRVYLVRGPEAAITYHWNQAVLFSLVVPQDVELTTGFTLSVHRVGDSLDAASAQAYCLDLKVLDY